LFPGTSVEHKVCLSTKIGRCGRSNWTPRKIQNASPVFLSFAARPMAGKPFTNQSLQLSQHFFQRRISTATWGTVAIQSALKSRCVACLNRIVMAKTYFVGLMPIISQPALVNESAPVVGFVPFKVGLLHSASMPYCSM